MSNYARQEKLDDFKSGLCSMQMECGHCICEDCPRDCAECEERGVQPNDSACLHEGDGKYRKEEQG